MVPGNPKLSLTATWALAYDPEGEWAPDTSFIRSMKVFLAGDDATKGGIFKLIPRCVRHKAFEDTCTSECISCRRR